MITSAERNDSFDKFCSVNIFYLSRINNGYQRKNGIFTAEEFPGYTQVTATSSVWCEYVLRKGKEIMRKRLLSCLLAAALGLGTLTGCGGGSDGNAPGTGTESSSADKEGGENVVTFSMSEDVYTWDTMGQPVVPFYSIQLLIYDMLVRTDHAGNYEPGLATEWSVSDDGLDWTFKLREGVTFHNGEDFNAECVKATLERGAFNNTLNMNFLWSDIESVEAADDYTAVVHCKKPIGDMLNQLTYMPMLPAQALAEQGEELFQTSPGTGPWKFVSWDPGNEAVFVRSDDYWDWGDQKSNVDKIIYKPISEDTTRVSSMRTGEFDMISNIPPDQVEVLSGSEGVEVDSKPGTTISWMALQCGEGKPFADKNVRLALTHAIDRELIVESILGSGSPAYWPVMEGVTGYDQDLANQYSQYDPELAKKLLTESGYNGEEIYFMAIDGKVPRTKEVLQAVMSMMTEAGFNVKLEIMEGATFVTKRSAGDYDIAFSNVFYNNGSPWRHMITHWLSDSCNTELENPEITSLLTEARQTIDLEKQDELLKKAFSLMMEDGGRMCYFINLDTINAYSGKLSGIRLYNDTIVDLSRVMKN